MMFIVIENTPGYLPESEPVEFETLREAQEYAYEVEAQLVDLGYRVMGDRTDPRTARQSYLYAHPQLSLTAVEIVEVSDAR